MAVRHHFSMSDLMVTLALVAVIVSIGAPIVMSARKKARITACATQQRQLYAAADGFAVDHERMVRYGDTSTSYFDVLEGQAADGEFGRFLRNYADVDTVAESGLHSDGDSQLALGNWASSMLRCPTAATPSKWWYDNYHHAMAPWETMSYRFAGIDVFAGQDSPFGDRQFGRMTDPSAVVFLQDNTLSPEAQRMNGIFGEMRRNNHQYSGLYMVLADGSGRWTDMGGTTTLASLGQESSGYYRTSQPVDGQVQWWRGELHVIPTDAYNAAPGLRVYTPSRYGVRKMQTVSYSSERVRSHRALQLADDARQLGYTLRDAAEDQRRRPSDD